MDNLPCCFTFKLYYFRLMDYLGYRARYFDTLIILLQMCDNHTNIYYKKRKTTVSIFKCAMQLTTIDASPIGLNSF